jgi:RNase adaptor protein for sRNA GlmZ degradation
MNNPFRLLVIACGTNYGEPPPHHHCVYLAHHEPWASLYEVAGREPVANPHYVESLRPLDGQHPSVRDYIFQDREALWRREKLDKHLVTLFETVCSEQRCEIPELVGASYEVEGIVVHEPYVIVTLCTGGKHRSQAFAIYISVKATELAAEYGIELEVDVVFRDEGKE